MALRGTPSISPGPSTPGARASVDSYRRHAPRHSRPHPFAPSDPSRSSSTAPASAPAPRPPSSANTSHGVVHSRASLPPANAGIVPPGGHPLSLKVMRVSQPTLAATDWPYFEASEYQAADQLVAHAAASDSGAHQVQDILDSDLTEWERAELAAWNSDPQLATQRDTLDQVRDAWELEARTSLLSNELHLAPAWQEGKSALGTLRDLPVSDLLMLPASFGTVYEGETFSAFLCVNNEASAPVAGATLKAEMHYGPGAVPSGQQGPDASAPVHVVPLALVSTPPNTDRALLPAHKLEVMVRHPVTQSGPHGLVCTVSYLVPRAPSMGSAYASLDDPAVQPPTMVETYYRKFYRFQVAPAPVLIEARVLPCTPTASIQFSPNPYVRKRILLQVTVINRAAPGAPPMAIDTVEPGCDDSDAPKWYWRQLDRPHVRCAWWDDELLGSLMDDPGSNSGSSGSSESSASESLLLPGEIRRYIYELYPTHPNRRVPLPPPATEVEGTATGYVKALCRSYMGEPTRVRSDPTTHISTFPVPSLVDPSTTTAQDHATSSDKATPAVHAARPKLQLQTELSVISTPTDGMAGEPFTIEYELWVRDVGLASSDSHRRTYSDAGDGSEDEDDRPLSEVASDVARSQTHSRAQSVSSSRASSVHDKRPTTPRLPSVSSLGKVLEGQAQLQAHPVWLRLAIQRTHVSRAAQSLPSGPTTQAPAAGSAYSQASSLATPLGYVARPPPGEVSRNVSQLSRASSVTARATSTASTATATGLQRASTTRQASSSFLPPAFQRGYLAQRETSSSSPASNITADLPAVPAAPTQEDSLPPEPPAPVTKHQKPMWPSPEVVLSHEAHSDGLLPPDSDVVALGSSVLPSPPIRLAPDQASATVPFTAKYLTSLPGNVRVGGLRVLLVDWWTETEDPNANPAQLPLGMEPWGSPLTLLDLGRDTVAEVELA